MEGDKGRRGSGGAILTVTGRRIIALLSFVRLGSDVSLSNRRMDGITPTPPYRVWYDAVGRLEPRAASETQTREENRSGSPALALVDLNT